MPDLPSIAELVRKYGLAANKGYGQHFLFDSNLTDKMVRLAGIQSGERVVEIGPGPGGLTRSLLKAGANVTAIEADARFEAPLQEISSHFHGSFRLHLADALKTQIQQLKETQPLKIVSNLPYNVGTALLTNWLGDECLQWTSMTLMFQKEVAERIVAQPGTVNYGRLAVLVAATARSQIIMNVPARAFTPPPKVESAVVHILPLSKTERFSDLQRLSRLTRMAFGQRRKMLRASLKPLKKELSMPLEDWLYEAGVAADVRPETVTPAQFMQLASSL